MPGEKQLVRAVMIGDVVGEVGLKTLEALLPELIREQKADFVIVNGENAAEGYGMTADSLKRILAAGADMITTGNHIWEKRDFWSIMEKESRLLRPANYPETCSGRGWSRVEKSGISWLAVNLQGRELMSPIECPFKTFDRIWAERGTALVLVDFHAESTKEKESLGYYLDGRASLVAGTHTHIPTADDRILPQGTGYITDLGMTGPRESIIGMDSKVCVDRARTQVFYRMACAHGPGVMQGISAVIDLETGKAVSIARIKRFRAQPVFPNGSGA